MNPELLPWLCVMPIGSYVMGFASCHEDDERRRQDAAFLEGVAAPEHAALLRTPIDNASALSPAAEQSLSGVTAVTKERRSPYRFTRGRPLNIDCPQDVQRRATAILMRMNRDVKAAIKAKRRVIVPE